MRHFTTPARELQAEFSDKWGSSAGYEATDACRVVFSAAPEPAA